VSVVSSRAVGESGFVTPRMGKTAPPVWSVCTWGTVGGTFSSLAMLKRCSAWYYSFRIIIAWNP